MTRRLVAVFIALVLFSLPVVAREDETDRRPLRIPTIEEVQAELDRVGGFSGDQRTYTHRLGEPRILLQGEATEL